MAARATWNGKFRGTGNGGLGGGAGVDVNALAGGVRRGYATAGHNTGHEGDSSYALEHPEQIKDFGYRATHEMTVTSKALIRAVLRQGAERCRTWPKAAAARSRRSARRSAIRRTTTPIAVTGMSSYLTRHTFAQMWMWQATHQDAASFIPPDKYPVLHDAALAACDALATASRTAWSAIPSRCRFDPASVQCKDERDRRRCLTPPQVEAARKIYQGPRQRAHRARSSTRRSIPAANWAGVSWPAARSRSASRWSSSSTTCCAIPRGTTGRGRSTSTATSTASDRPEIQPVNAVDPDLRRFFARGGKLLLVGRLERHGGAAEGGDQLLQPRGGHGGRARRRASRCGSSWCPAWGTGRAPAAPINFNFDALSLIEQWKEQAVAPDQLIVGHYKDGKRVGSRLVCQYPQVAFYKGGGLDAEDAASFECRSK